MTLPTTDTYLEGVRSRRSRRGDRPPRSRSRDRSRRRSRERSLRLLSRSLSRDRSLERSREERSRRRRWSRERSRSELKSNPRLQLATQFKSIFQLTDLDLDLDWTNAWLFVSPLEYEEVEAEESRLRGHWQIEGPKSKCYSTCPWCWVEYGARRAMRLNKLGLAPRLRPVHKIRRPLTNPWPPSLDGLNLRKKCWDVEVLITPRGQKVIQSDTNLMIVKTRWLHCWRRMRPVKLLFTGPISRWFVWILRMKLGILIKARFCWAIRTLPNYSGALSGRYFVDQALMRLQLVVRSHSLQ